MSSRATSVLFRLKEMDTKYKSNLEKTLEKFSDISAISSDEKTEKSIKSPNILKPKLNIKLPDTFIEKVDSFSSNSEDDSIKSVKVVDANAKLSSRSSISKQIARKNVDEDTIVGISSQSLKDNDESISEKTVEDHHIDSDEKSISEDIEELIESNTSKSQKIIHVDEEKTLALLNEAFGKEEEEKEEDHNSEEYSDDSFESGSSESENEHLEISEHSTKINLLMKNKDNNFINNNSNQGFQKSSSESSSTKLISSKVGFQSEKNYNDENYSDEDKYDNRKFKNEDINNSKSEEIESNSKELIQLENEAESEQERKSTTQENSQVDKSSTNTTSTRSEKEEISLKTSMTDSSRKTSSESLKKKDIHSDQRLNKCSKKLKDKKNTYVSQLALNNKEKTLKKTLRKLSEEKEMKEKFHENKKKRSLSMIRYLKQIEEDRQRLIVWPTNFVCSNSKNEILKPLEAPKLSHCIQPVISTNSTNQNKDLNIKILQSRIFDISQWMKNQYSIYKEQCDLAVTINSTHKPTNYEEAEKIVQQFRLRTRSLNK